MKKYDNYKYSNQDFLGKIPSHWFSTTLKRIAEVKDGTHDTPSYIEEDGIPFITTKDLSKGNISFENCKYISYDDYLSINKRSNVENGDIIMPMIGSIGSPIIVKTDKPFSIKNLALIKKNAECDLRYICYYLDSEATLYQFGLCTSGGVQNFISLGVLRNLGIPKMEKEEQTAIANYLDYKTTQIDTLIAKKEQFIILLQEERTAVINQAVTKGLDPNVKMKDSGIEWLGEIPEHWEVKKLKLVFNPSKGLTITKENLKDEGIQCVNYGEVHSKFGFELDTNIHELKYVDSSYLESNERSLIECGDFVFADTSEDIAGAGNFTYLKSEDKIFAGYHTIILKPIENLDSRFFAYEFDSIPFRTQIRQSVKGVKVFSITQAILKNVNTWFPPKNEQKVISDFLTIETDKIDSIILKTKEEIELLKEYKTALISEVVTGKVDVRDVVLN